MICEQVKELLSPYLDNALASEELHTIATHLEHCPECNGVLTDFHRFDTLLSRMPRISPRAALRERIFSSPEYLELIGTSGALDSLTRSTVSQQRVRPDVRSQFVALPGGRAMQPTVPKDADRREARPYRDRASWGQRMMQVVIAATVLLTLGVGGFIGWNLWQRQTTVANNVNGITPPAALQQGPIPAGTRFLFLRSGALWSAPSDGSNGVRRLTQTQTTVATSWTVRPALARRSAGDMVAYIDLQQGYVHIVRSDGQNDTVIQQALLQPGQAMQWKTGTGAAVLNGLVWSKDGSMLAFIAAPRGIPQLYIYTPATKELQQVALPMAGAVSHPVWSPDSIRIAFEVQTNGNVYILDYNTQKHDALTLSTVTERPGDTVLSLDWSSNTTVPALTWSVGGVGHVHSIWTQRVGIVGNMGPTLLISGDYLEAQYSQNGHGRTGSWLLVANNAPGVIVTLNLVGGIERVISGKQASAAQWSPDGISIGYFAALASRSGVYHVVNTLTGVDTLIASGVAVDPAPTWSADSSHLAYSTGTRTLISTVQSPGPARSLTQQGTATALSWSITIPSQLVLVVDGGQHGIYLIDTQHNTSLQLDKGSIQGPIQWTEIP